MRMGIYYNPEINSLIEIYRQIPFEVCGIEIELYEVFDRLDNIKFNKEKIYYPTGPILGLTKDRLKGYKYIGKVW